MEPKKQVARRAVAPLGPFGKLRKVVPALLEEGLSIHTIKGIGEVNFDKNSTAGIAMPMTPLPGGLQANFCPQRLSNPDLQREEMGQGFVFDGRAEDLGRESAQGFANCYGADSVIFLRQGSEVGAG